MKQKLLRTGVLSLLVLLLFTVCGCEKPTIRPVSPQRQEAVTLANDDVMKFITDYTPDCFFERFDRCTDRYEPKIPEIRWECDEAPRYYEVLLSENPDLSDAATYCTAAEVFRPEDLKVASTYYWQVKAFYDDQIVLSDVFTFRTAETPRTVSIEGVFNTRDIGGLPTADGSRIRQNLVFRGAQLDSSTRVGKQKMLNQLGIRTEIDLRKKGEASGGTGSLLGKSVNYVHIEAPSYVSIQTSANKALIAEEIRVFADPENYPVYFHCVAGRDRTGTLAFLLESLLGVPEELCFRDYEMTLLCSYSNSDTASVAKLVPNSFTPLVQYIKSYGAGKSLSLRECTELYLKDCGITDAEIASIRSILLEK